MEAVVDVAMKSESVNIALKLQDATYLISRESAEQFLKLLVPAFLKEDADTPGMAFLQNAVKTFLRMNLPGNLKQRYGDKWTEHMPPKHTDLLQWTLNNLVSDVVSDLTKKDWQIDVDSVGNDDNRIYQVRGLSPVASRQIGAPAGHDTPGNSQQHNA